MSVLVETFSLCRNLACEALVPSEVLMFLAINAANTFGCVEEKSL
jgi:hypothetical protein